MADGKQLGDTESWLCFNPGVEGVFPLGIWLKLKNLRIETPWERDGAQPQS